MKVSQLKKEIENLDDDIEILLAYPEPNNKSVAHTDFTIDKDRYEKNQYFFRTVRHPKGWRHPIVKEKENV